MIGWSTTHNSSTKSCKIGLTSKFTFWGHNYISISSNESTFWQAVALKVHNLFFKILFSASFEESSLQRCKLKISVEMVKPFWFTKQFCILQLSISYCVSLIMVTITRHIFLNIFQTEHFSSVKFAMGYEKNMSFPVIPKSPKVWKKVKKIRLGSFKLWHFRFFDITILLKIRIHMRAHLLGPLLLRHTYENYTPFL